MSNLKNIRSITVAGSPLLFGTDYTYDTEFIDTTKKTKITFTSAQTGAYTIIYDFGTDKIWPDYPRDDLSISSYPRIAIDTQDSGTDAFGIGGNDYITDLGITVVAYAKTTSKVSSLVSDIRQKLISSNQEFFYFKFLKPVGVGPIIIDPTSKKEIVSRSIDFLSKFNVECIN